MNKCKNFHLQSKEDHPAFFALIQKLGRQIQINCRCPNCNKAGEWQPCSLIPFFLPPFFLLFVSLSVSVFLSLFLHATGKGLKRNVTAHALPNCATGITACRRKSLMLKVKSPHSVGRYVRKNYSKEITAILSQSLRV